MEDKKETEKIKPSHDNIFPREFKKAVDKGLIVEGTDKNGQPIYYVKEWTIENGETQ